MEDKNQGGSKKSVEPSSKVLGKDSVPNKEKRPSSSNQAPKLKPANLDDILKSLDAGNHRYLRQEPPADPCYMSSSIYYGGPDIIPQPQSSQGAGFNSAQSNYGGEDDSGAATRGNWWQGSLYY